MHLSQSEIAGKATRVGIGEGRTGGPNDSLRATLGSCVGACLIWPSEEVFVLLHVLLPYAVDGTVPAGADRTRYAETAVDWGLDELKVPKWRRREVVAYIAGGSSMFPGDGQQIQVGEANQEALIAALKRSRVRVKASDLGGSEGRQLVVDGPSCSVFSINLEAGLIETWEFPGNFGIKR